MTGSPQALLKPCSLDLLNGVTLVTLLKTNMTMEKQTFEDVSPIKHADFPASHVSFRVVHFSLISSQFALPFYVCFEAYSSHC